MKRLLDIVLILLSLPIMLPVALIVAIAIKLDSPGPVLYWSERIGRNGRPFIMPKFRSMSVGAPIVEAEKFTNAGSYTYYVRVNNQDLQTLKEDLDGVVLSLQNQNQTAVLTLPMTEKELEKKKAKLEKDGIHVATALRMLEV